MTTSNDIALLREAHGWRRNEVQALGAALSCRNWHMMETAYNRLRDKMDAAGCWHEPKALAPGQHDGAAGEGQAELDYFNRTTCACTAAGQYAPNCEKHGAKPAPTEQARANPQMTAEEALELTEYDPETIVEVMRQWGFVAAAGDDAVGGGA